MPPLESILLFLVIGGVAGWLAGQITDGSGFGFVGNVVLGILGAALAGHFLPGLLNDVLPLDGILGQIAHATVGAVLVLFLIRFIKG